MESQPNSELEDLRELRRLLEAMAVVSDPPLSQMIGSLSRYVSAKDAVFKKLKEIQAKEPRNERDRTGESRG